MYEITIITSFLREVYCHQGAEVSTWEGFSRVMQVIHVLEWRNYCNSFRTTTRKEQNSHFLTEIFYEDSKSENTSFFISYFQNKLGFLQLLEDKETDLLTVLRM